MERLTIVVRADMPAGAQLAQSCHALAAFAVAHEAPFAAWQPAGAIVCLAVPDEPALAALLERAATRGLRRAAYREPDLGNEFTALALGDGAKPLTSGLPLALRRAVELPSRHARPPDPGHAVDHHEPRAGRGMGG